MENITEKEVEMYCKECKDYFIVKIDIHSEGLDFVQTICPHCSYDAEHEICR